LKTKKTCAAMFRTLVIEAADGQVGVEGRCPELPFQFPHSGSRVRIGLGANFGSAINSCSKAHIDLAHVGDIIDKNLRAAKKIRRNFCFSDEGASELAVF
jgi:hypothetical protein